MEKGIGGFRLDVIDQIAKEPDQKITANGPHLHEYIREMSANTFQKGNVITVGETWGANTDNAKLYSNPDHSEFSMIFQFEHVMLDQQPGKEKWDLYPLDFMKLKDVLERWQKSLHGCGWNSLFWNNHDLPRIVSRWGEDGEYRTKSAKMLATLLHGMQGTPYIYQGEELGMTNAKFGLEDYRDIESVNMYHERLEKGYTKEEVLRSLHAKSRDNARTPMQWDDSENAGFSDAEPWLKVNENYHWLNAKEELKNPDSVFYHYQKLIAFRKKYPVFVDGTFELLCKEDPQVFAYVRENETEQLLVVCNFYGEKTAFTMPQGWEDATCLLTNETGHEDGMLQPYEAFLYHKEK